MKRIGEKRTRFSVNICLTHNCNLGCVYCYQKHDLDHVMSIETAKKTLDWIFNNKPDFKESYEIRFFGGEPLLEFEMIKELVDYVQNKEIDDPYVLYATTNGTLLDDDIKNWCTSHREFFHLGLSLDGKKLTQDHNRCNSFDKIDIDYFIKTWPRQAVKMTISEFGLSHLAEDIIYLHELGFQNVGGVNLFEGGFNWDKDEYIKIIIPQLRQLVDYYVENDTLELNQMFRVNIDWCAAKNAQKLAKWCGVGISSLFFDTDGKKYPCPYITPMTFPENELEEIMKTDFNDDNVFIDKDCMNNCYLYPVCQTCPGVNYEVNKTFNIRTKNKCQIQKLIALFVADLQGKKLLKNPKRMEPAKKYYTIEAIKKIKELYYNEFKLYL